MFLRPFDYETAVKAEELSRLIPNDQVRDRAYRTALAEAKSYLAYRYDVSKIFVDITPWDPTKTYQNSDPVSLEAEAFDSNKTYQTDELAEFEGSIYRATTSTSGTDPDQTNDFELAGAADTIYVSQKDNNTTLPNSQDWKQEDPRQQQFRTFLVDMTLYHLYSLTQPRNIPEYRIKRREDAMKYLKDVNDGIVQVDLPERSPDDDNDENVRYGAIGGNSMSY